MANVNTPFGFRPIMRTFTGGSGTIQPTHKLAGYATALFINDAVTHAAAGTKPTLAVDAAITPGTAPVLGVNLIYQAASVATDGATFLVAASLQKTFNMAMTAGNTVTRVSKHSISETSVATTNTLDLKIRGLVQDSAGAAVGSKPEHQLGMTMVQSKGVRI